MCASAWGDVTHAMRMRVKGYRTWAQASDRNLSCDVGVAVISLISSSRFSIIVFMASSADSRARSFSAHLQETGKRLRPLVSACQGLRPPVGCYCVLRPSAQQQGASRHLPLNPCPFVLTSAAASLTRPDVLHPPCQEY